MVKKQTRMKKGFNRLMKKGKSGLKSLSGAYKALASSSFVKHQRAINDQGNSGFGLPPELTGGSNSNDDQWSTKF